MLYEPTIRYLKAHFQEFQSDITFSDDHSAALYKTLTEASSPETVAAKRDEIRKAIQDFWKNVARVSVFFKGLDKIIVKTRPLADPETERLVKARAFATENDETAFCRKVVNKLADNELNYTRIPNAYFEINYLALLRHGLHYAVREKISDEALAAEVTLTIVKTHFAELHDLLAEALIQTAIFNPGADRFLGYYTGRAVIENRRRYQTPSIIDRSGNQWFSPAIKVHVLKYNKEKTKVEAVERTLQIYRDQLAEAKQTWEHLKSITEEVANSAKMAEVNFRNNTENIQKMRDRLHGLRAVQLKAKDPDALDDSIAKLVKEIKEAKLADIELAQKKSRTAYALRQHHVKLKDAEKEVLGVEQHLEKEKNKNKTLFQNWEKMRKTYDLIVDAVANALMKKRVPLG